MVGELDWYAVVTQAQREDDAARWLRHVCQAVYAPVRRKQVRRRGKRREVLARVFPGYLFVGVLPGCEPWLAISRLPAVIGVVGCGLRPAKLLQTDIALMHSREWCGCFDGVFASDDLLSGRTVSAKMPLLDEDVAGVGLGRIKVISIEQIFATFGGRRTLDESCIAS